MAELRFEQVSKQFSGMARPAVDHCSFEVDDGQFIVLLGPSGCGKTTLMKMVNRLYDPSSGTIYWDGKDIQQINVTELRRQIGYVIQQIGLFPHMTVAQNVQVVPKLLGWKQARMDERADELLAQVDLPPAQYRDRYPSQLSGGQQQRVGVARALAGDPDLILMDEPFGAVDAITRTSLQDEMLHLQQQLKKTILFVTHDVDEALRLADRIVIMRAGKIVQYASPIEILTQPTDDFVHELIGADDMVRQLGLVRVESIMQRLPSDFHRNGHPTVGADQTLRDALSIFLRSDTDALLVLDGEHPAGLVTLHDIRRSTDTGQEARKPESAHNAIAPVEKRNGGGRNEQQQRAERRAEESSGTA